MNRVLLSQVQQLKCNFCTQWFSVPSQFASLQKYSLNACHKCMTDFKYRLVDPTTFEIYDVLLVKTGIQMTNKQYQLTQKFEAYMKMHRDSNNINEESFSKLKQEDLRNADLKAEVNMHTQPIKERVSETCRKLLDGLIKNWNEVLSQLQKQTFKFDYQRQRIIKALGDKYYNFAKDTEKLLSDERVQSQNSMLQETSQEIKKITADKLLSKIKSFVSSFFGLNLKQQNQQIQNKENNTPNSKSHLRNIREKLMRNSRKIQSNNNELKILNTNMKSNSKQFNKSSQKSLLKPDVPMLKKERSERSIKVITPRPQRIEFDTIQVEKPTCVLDQYRDKMSKLLKQATDFQSYMPTEPQKIDLVMDRTYGQKCMIEYLVELKMKTTLNSNLCEIINQNLSKGNISCYLRSLEWKPNISVIKLVKVKLHDAQFDTFLHWLSDKTNVQILVVTNNFLTELSVEAIHAFCYRHREMNIKQIYMGNNYIRPSRARRAIEGLKNINIDVFI